LPATIRLVDRGPGESLLAQAFVPDPCFWTTELPFLYTVRVELRRGQELLQAVERPLGIRPLGVAGRRLRMESKAWVLRAAHQSLAPNAPLAEWHAADTAMTVAAPGDSLCDEASRVGVLLVAGVAGDRRFVLSELQRLCRWPAVGLAIINSADPLDLDIRLVARNLLLAQPISPNSSFEPAPWAHLVVSDCGYSLHPSPTAHSLSLPMLAFRPAERRPTVSELRALIDLLQRDLAGHLDPAGYLI
jgi:hypothetical protein